MELRSGCRIHNTTTLAQLSRVFPLPQVPCHTYTLMIFHPDECSGFLSDFSVFTLSAFPQTISILGPIGGFSEEHLIPWAWEKLSNALHCRGQLNFLGSMVLWAWSMDPGRSPRLAGGLRGQNYFHNIKTLFVFYTVDSGPAGTKAVADDNVGAL